jgi:hypothetical protein
MKLENLELIEVRYTDDKKKATLTFLDEENGEVREINFNKQSWDDKTGGFIDDEEKAAKVDEWSQEYFGLDFLQLPKAVGETKDVYAYDNFNSLWEMQIVQKFGDDMLGQIIQVPCTEIIDDGTAIRIRFEYEGKTYESKMSYADYLEVKKAWFVNPQKQTRQYAKFEQKFHIPIENMEDLVGKTLMVEVKKAMGKYIYNEVKAFPKK